MFTAPILEISSILIWVQIFPADSRMLRTSSVVMASTPQPKDTSCTRFTFFPWEATHLAAA